MDLLCLSHDRDVILRRGFGYFIVVSSPTYYVDGSPEVHPSLRSYELLRDLR